jgi:hypothetical protein
MEPLSWTGPGNKALLAMPLDEELDRYRWLAYLQRVNERYRERKLYPCLDELRTRFEQLTRLCQGMDRIDQAIPGRITGVDLARKELIRAPRRGNVRLQAVDRLIANALPDLSDALDRGAELRERLTAHIHMEPVGILPLHTTEGYFLLRHGSWIRVYSYLRTVPGYFMDRSCHLDVRTRFVTDYAQSCGWNFEQIKLDLVRNFTAMPNPAVYAFTAEVSLPSIETFVPLAKQLVYETIAGQ